MWICVLASLAAGGCFAAAGVLQQRAAASRPSDESLSPRLIAHLARQPVWLGGIAFALLSYGFQSLALAFGPLSLVQPIVVTELVFALPISVRLHHLRLGVREWGGAALVVAGLAVAIAAAAPSEGDPRAPGVAWLVTLLAVAVLAGGAVLAGRVVRGPARASLFALGAATIMGCQSALLATTIAHLQHGLVETFTAWQTYVLVAASVVGLLLIQSAFQAGPLAAGLPVIDAVEPVVAVVIGLVLFHETLAPGVLRHVGAAAALAALLVGIVVLDTSPVIHRLHEQESEESEQDEDAPAGARRS